MDSLDIADQDPRPTIEETVASLMQCSPSHRGAILDDCYNSLVDAEETNASGLNFDAMDDETLLSTYAEMFGHSELQANAAAIIARMTLGN